MEVELQTILIMLNLTKLKILGLTVLVTIGFSTAFADNKCRELFSSIEQVLQANHTLESNKQRFEDIREAFSQLIADSEQVQFLDKHLWSFKYEVDKAKGDLDKAGFKLDEQRLIKSDTVPTVVWIEQGTLGKSLVLWKGQLFVEGHFRSMAFTSEFRGPRKRAAIENTINTQLWGSWNSELKKFEFKTIGAQKSLLQNFYKTKVLYRGMKDFEFSVLQALAHLYRSDFSTKRSVIVKNLEVFKDKAKLSEADRNQIEKAVQLILGNSLNKEDCIRLADEILSLVYNDQSANRVLPLFTSPNLKIGEKWAKPDVAQFNIPSSALLKLSDKGELYAGVEDIDLEIGFYSLRSWKVLIQSIVLVD